MMLNLGVGYDIEDDTHGSKTWSAYNLNYMTDKKTDKKT